jgi:molybdopterin-containing oxidoreductase family membrane subunit
VTSLGWTGSHNQWKHYEAAYLLFAALATPLVISVHSVVSWDFAMASTPGWHATIFPPYFVAGAIFSGVAMVITLLIPIRSAFKLHPLVTLDHFEAMAKLILVTSGIVSYAYITEFYSAWFSNNKYEQYQFWFRPFGEHRLAFWGMAICNCMIPQLLWVRSIRRNITILFIITIFINIGMWLERYNIIVQSLARDYLPSAWASTSFTWTEIGITVGAFGWFGMFMTVFVKYFPAVAITEIKMIMDPPVRNASAAHGH